MRRKISLVGEVRAYLKNKNMSLYYWLKHKIGKKRALRITLPICNILTRKGDRHGRR